MFADLIAGTPGPLLVALAIAGAGAGVMRLAIIDMYRARWRREFGGGWRALQRARIARTVPAPSNGAITRTEQAWQSVQRNRVARRRCAQAS